MMWYFLQIEKHGLHYILYFWGSTSQIILSSITRFEWLVKYFGPQTNMKMLGGRSNRMNRNITPENLGYQSCDGISVTMCLDVVTGRVKRSKKYGLPKEYKTYPKVEVHSIFEMAPPLPYYIPNQVPYIYHILYHKILLVIRAYL